MWFWPWSLWETGSENAFGPSLKLFDMCHFFYTHQQQCWTISERIFPPGAPQGPRWQSLSQSKNLTRNERKAVHRTDLSSGYELEKLHTHINIIYKDLRCTLCVICRGPIRSKTYLYIWKAKFDWSPSCAFDPRAFVYCLVVISIDAPRVMVHLCCEVVLYVMNIISLSMLVACNAGARLFSLDVCVCVFVCVSVRVPASVLVQLYQ